MVVCIFFFKQKTAYEMRISDWSSDVCSSDLPNPIEVDFVIVGALIGTDPALLIPRIPEKIGLLGLQEPMRQSLPDTVAELHLQPRNQRRPHAIRRHRNGLKHAHDHLLHFCPPSTDTRRVGKEVVRPCKTWGWPYNN